MDGGDGGGGGRGVGKACPLWLQTHFFFISQYLTDILLYTPSHRQDCTNHDLCYTSRGETTWATLSDYKQGIFYMEHPSDRITHTMTFVTPVMEHWLEQEIAQWVNLFNDTQHILFYGYMASDIW